MCAQIRITMAAIDPTQPPETDSEGNVPSVPRATLKLIKTRGDIDDEEDDEEADEYLESLLANEDDEEESDEEEEEEDEEANGGPSDPAKSKKARREAALKKLLEAAAEEESDEDMEDADGKANGSKKGKEKASDDDEEDEEDDDSDSDDGFDLEEYVICTLDTERVSRSCVSPPIPPAHTFPRTISSLWISPSVRTRGPSSSSLEHTPST